MPSGALQFVTTIPLNVWKGSGCFVGIDTLAKGIRALGGQVNLVAPKHRFPIYALERVRFNHFLRYRAFPREDVVVGFDADGYSIAGRRNSRHIASIKGVIGDVIPYENARSKVSLNFHARLERLHAQRADLVVTPSQYCANRIEELYRVRNSVVVPELIDLDAWRALLRDHPAPAAPRTRFVVLCVCRFYPRKCVPLLLRAAAILKTKLPDLEVRIVGGGPEAVNLRRLWRELNLDGTVLWLGDVSLDRLAQEYNGADVFCLPSMQEGFGIVFLEAMAAGLPIVAMRASAVPEVVQHGLLVEPDNLDALVAAIENLHANPGLRASLGEQGKRDVERFEMRRVAQRFLDTIGQ